jgi:serine/threonine-protein kinase
MSMLKQGDRINNYLLDRCVGSGSFAEVWRARHHVLGDIVAIKIPTDLQYVRNLQREGVVVHGLRHPNIVRVIDLDPYGDPPYMVMECIEGPSLREAIDHYGDEFPVSSAVEVMCGVLGALSASHDQALIHRDIKPANILLAHPLDELGTITRDAVRVTDFGLGKVGRVTTESIMQSGSVEADAGHRIAGTLAYMAPEQKEGADAEPPSDLYSCGIVLFEMLTGKRPHGSEVPSALRREAPGQLDEVFKRCYARRDRRYESALDMLRALDAGGTPPPLPPPESREDVRVGVGGVTCPGCQATVLGTDNFCISCGCQLVARTPTCQHCGGFVQLGDRYCIKCGKSLTVMS